MACEYELGVPVNCIYGLAANCSVPKEPGSLDPIVGLTVEGHDRYFTVIWDVVASFPNQIIEIYYRSLSPISSNTLDDKDGDPLQDKAGDPILSKEGLLNLSAENIGSGSFTVERDAGRGSSEAVLRKGMLYKVFVRVATATEADDWSVVWVYTDEAKRVVTHNGELVHYNGVIVVY